MSNEEIKLRLGEHGLFVLWDDIVCSSTGEYRIPRCERVDMARIDTRILGAVIYLYCSEDEAKKGSLNGGSGFLFSVRSDEDTNYAHVYAVTNTHVVRGRDAATVIRITIDTRTDTGVVTSRKIIPLKPDQWIAHPDGDDVAVAYLGTDKLTHPEGRSSYVERYGWTIPSYLLLTRDVMEKLDFGPGEDVYMCGRFAHHPGEYFNEPSTRWGTVSLMPMHVKMGTMEKEVFLVELRSLSGFSGSPVAWKMPLDLETQAIFRALNQGKELPAIANRRILPGAGELLAGPWLVGLDRGSFPHKYEVTTKTGGKTNYQAVAHGGVAGVVPAWKLQELIEQEPRIRMAREKADKKLKEAKQETTVEFLEDVLVDGELTGEGFDDVLRRVSRKTTDSVCEPAPEAPQTDRQK